MRMKSARRVDLLKYSINELESAGIKPGEYDKLRRKLEIARNYQKTAEALARAYSALKGDDELDGAVSLLSGAEKALSSLRDEEWDKRASVLSSAASAAEDVSSAIYDFLENAEYSDIDPDEINARLDTLDKLMLKYGGGEWELLKALDKAREELNDIEFSDKKAAELSELLDSSVERLVALGEELTEVRKKAAAAFEKQVCDILSYLNMPDVRFTVQFAKGRYTKRGCDTAEFMISANRGESVKPLSKIASGGELSRVMLAIKSVLLGRDPVGTMIFDEIDTGISGYTAGKVGTQLKRVAENRQVICVTHLAQIAAMGDTHLLIEKKAEGDRTFTSVSPLSYEDRINEIARIMSGAQMTENLYNSAKELLDRSKQS